jgi:SpoVK/Ycf46/Vps4 family AAA+-type ATPase
MWLTFSGIEMHWYDKITSYVKNKISNVGVIVTDDIYRLYELINITRDRKEDACFVDLQQGDLDNHSFTLFSGSTVSRQTLNSDTHADFLYNLSSRCTVVLKWVVNKSLADRLEPIIFSLHSNIDMYDDRLRQRHPVLVFSVSYFWNIIDLASVEVNPTDEEYEQLLQQAKKVYEYAYKSEVVLPSSDVVKGLNLWTAQGVLRNSMVVEKDKVTFDSDKINDFKKEIFHKAGITLIKSDINFDFVGGQRLLKEYVRNKWKSILNHPEEAIEYGVRLPRGMILHGPPGTGKTWFVKALAGELNLLMLQINAADIFSKWVGESEQKLRMLTKYADITRAVLFIDELDALASKRTSEEHEVSRRVKNMFLEWLGDANRKAIVIGATNMLQELDEAFTRPGRFDDILPVSYPNREDLKEIFGVHIYKYNPIKHVDKLDMDRIAERAYGYYLKPNEVEKVVHNAKLKAFLSKGKLTTEIILGEIDEVGKTVNVSERLKYMNEYEKREKELLSSVNTRWF